MRTPSSKHVARNAHPAHAIDTVATAATSESRIEQAARRLDADIISITPERLLPVAIDVSTMVTTLLGCAPGILALAPELAELPHYDARPASHIEDYAFALLDAHQRTIGVAGDHRFDRQVARATKLRARFFATLEVLVAWDHFDAAALAALRAGTGYRDLAGDLVSCVINLRALAPPVRDRLLVTESDLDEAMELVAAIECTVGMRGAGTVEGVDPRVRRQQAYTLCVRMWDEVRRGVQFLRYSHGDADTIAPTLFAKNGVRRATVAEPAAPTAPEAPPVTAPAGSGALEATPAPAAKHDSSPAA